MHSVKIGIIGGSGMDNPNILENRTERVIKTPYGDPSDVIIEGDVNGTKCALLARHGRDHSIMPSNVNYRANIYALKEIGCTHLLVSTATGSLNKDILPGDLIVPNDFIDRTTKRSQTFYDLCLGSPKGVCHLPMFPAFCEETRKILINSAKELGHSVHTQGTIVTIEGPRFSSSAESRLFQKWDGDLINMTTCPEVVLAKEAGLLYAAVAIATDFDSWRQSMCVNVTEVLKVFELNVEKVKSIILRSIDEIAAKDWTEHITAAKKCVLENTMGQDKTAL